eukprot:evm.model.scf_468.5 EVM.evm.TU.scf_468.5   scf_468:28650-33560(+)
MASVFSMLPVAVLTDSYKATHFRQYPEASRMTAYGEFRCGYEKDDKDTRIVVFGIRYILENFVARVWTREEVEQAEQFFKSHMAPFFTEFPFPKDLFLRFVEENNGYFPIKVEALPEGTCIHAHVPVFQITAEGTYSPLLTYLETLLTMVWYPITVATLSRRTRDVIEKAFNTSVDDGSASPLVMSRLHDFGFRGCTCVEQSVIGGCSHLLNFTGTDTLSAAFYAQFTLNNGKPVGCSIPATEHSVMTAWRTEMEAIDNMVGQFGTGLFATVMDSYDYASALDKIVPCAAKKLPSGGFWVLRPDSGDVVEAVLKALHAAEKVFTAKENSKGFKVLQGCGVIQGDGMNIHAVARVLDAVMNAGFSAENVAFGMGGGLLQKLNRDTMSFATKLSSITYASGEARDVMKTPKNDSLKISLPGALAVKRVCGIPTVFPAGCVEPQDNLLKVVYDCGPIPGWQWEDFDSLRKRVASEWEALPRVADVISEPLKLKIEDTVACQTEANAQSYRPQAN